MSGRRRWGLVGGCLAVGVSCAIVAGLPGPSQRAGEPVGGETAQYRYLAEALARCDEGLYAHTQEWATTKRVLLADPDAWHDWTATYESVEQALAVSGDRHGKLYRPVLIQQLLREDETERADRSYLVPEVAVTADGIGLVTVPAFSSMIPEARDDYVRRGLGAVLRAQASGRVTQGWVVDLRQNYGGNLGPMFAAVSPLLPEGEIEEFVYPDGRVEVLRKGIDAIYLDRAVYQRLPQAVGFTSMPVAVLLSGMTGSAGEMTAMALLTNPRARSFGEKTSGFTSWVADYWLPDGGSIRISTAQATYANRPYFTGSLIPDTATPPDQAVERAASWVSRSARLPVSWLVAVGVAGA